MPAKLIPRRYRGAAIGCYLPHGVPGQEESAALMLAAERELPPMIGPIGGCQWISRGSPTTTSAKNGAIRIAVSTTEVSPTRRTPMTLSKPQSQIIATATII